MQIIMENNINHILSKAGKTKEKVKAAEKEFLDETATFGVRFERALINPHSKSKKTYNSVDFKPYGENGRVIGPMMDDYYPKYLDKGRGPIKAKLSGLGTGLKHNVSYLGRHIGAVALKFEYKGQIMFRKSVGPAKGIDFTKRTHSAIKGVYPSYAKKAINKALNS